MKKKSILTVLLFLCVSTLAVVVSAFAWFVLPGTYNPGFTAKVVKSYFDNSTGDNDGLSSSKPFIITKPVHLYNLAYLQNKGIFEGQTYYFQLGKLKSMIDTTSTDTNYYVYASNLSDETSNTGLTTTNMDMSQYNSGTIQPIGTSTYSFKSVLSGHGISISNLTVKGTSDMNYVGMFGYIGDGASIKNFNLDNITIAPDSTASATADTVGLVIGYMNGTTSTSITLEGVGVKNSKINGNRKANSKFALIGGGSDVSMAALDQGYNISGDTGVMYGDEMFAAIQDGTAPFLNNFTTENGGGSGPIYVAYNKTKAWLGSDGTSFGIFNLGTNATASQVAFGSYFSTQTVSYFNFDTEFEAEYENPTVDETDQNDNTPAITGSFTTSAAKMTSVTLNSGTDIANKFIDSNEQPIQNANYSLALPGKAQYNLTMSGIDYANNNKTATVYQNALWFTINSATGGYINFICSVPSDKTTSDRNIGIWKLDTAGTRTDFGSFYKNEPNYFFFTMSNKGDAQTSNLTAAFSFKLPKGTYLISSSKSGLYFNYVSVSGTNGSTGSETSGIPIDFISELSQHVWETSYVFSGVAFTIAETTDENFTIKFVRTQYDTPNSFVAVSGTFNSASITIYNSSISSTLYSIIEDTV